MKRIFFHLFFLAFLLSNVTLAQKKTPQLLLNGGFQNSRNYNGIFQPYFCDEGCIVTTQTSKPSFDYNLLFKKKLNTSNLSQLIGTGINRKSWTGNGLSSDGASPIENPFKWENKLDYLGIFYGVDFERKWGKKVSFFGRAMLTPELLLNRGNDFYKRISVSIRTNIGLEYQLNQSFGIQLNPFFQSAIMNYAKENDYTNKFIPYSIGLNLGLVFN